MRIAHIGPPLCLTGGPAGYLYQLQQAFTERDDARHELLLPPRAPTGTSSPRRSVVRHLRQRVGVVKRALVGAPKFYRPSRSELAMRGGPIDRYMKTVVAETVAAAGASMDAALGPAAAEVLFVHDAYTAESVVARRAPRQRVLLMTHISTPQVLHLVWNYVMPEMDPAELLGLPDVRAWIDREFAAWLRVDGLVLPSPEAGEDLLRLDARFAERLNDAYHLLTGASRRTGTSSADTAAARRQLGLPLDSPIGLYLGSWDRYRAPEALFAALERIPGRQNPPGLIAVAGPEAESVPRHPRVRALGRVADVSTLLRAVDFVVNVNRFTLFDLSNIEAAEAGKPLLLHAVGGNKTFRRIGVGCVMLPTIDPPTLAGGLLEMFTMPEHQRRRLAQASRNAYEDHLTLDHFKRRHLALYDQLHQDAGSDSRTCSPL